MVHGALPLSIDPFWLIEVLQDERCKGTGMDAVRFSGHQSFSLRNTWLTKGVLACAENPSIFREPDAPVTLGVGKNMVDAIKYWCQATRVLKNHDDQSEHRFDLQPTLIGSKLFVEDGGWDPYLEDKGTIWLLHWLLATNAEVATTIYLAFNEWPGLEFSRKQIESWISRRATAADANASANTLNRDVGVLVRSYAGGPDRTDSSVEDVMDSPLAELSLLYEETTPQLYGFARGPKDSLPDEVVVYALWEYAQRGEGRTAFTFDELAYDAYSPGRVFKLDELALAARLENVMKVTDAAWQPTETAGFRQMMMSRDIDPIAVLDSYYIRTLQGNGHGSF